MSGRFYEFFFWSEENFKSIQKVLGGDLSDEVKSELQQAHRYFAINMTIGPSRLSKTRSKLEKISKVLQDYEDIDSYTEHALTLALPYTKCPSIQDVNHDIRKLLERAMIALKGMPLKDKPGPDKKIWPLLTLVTSLKGIYEKSTGKRVGLSKAKESKRKKQNAPQGPFFRFVKEYLHIVKYQPHSDIALMRTIEEVIYHPNSLNFTETM
jgi:hypothetical protein